MVDADVERLLDELYASEPTDFITTRHRIARELRGDGRKDDAALIAARRRPTAAADAVNRIARGHAEELQEFLHLGTRLRDAQVASVQHPDARDEVRALQRERRTMLEQLAAYAPAHRDDVERGFAAALVDDHVALRVQRGQLERVPEPASGFDALGSALGDLPQAGTHGKAANTHPARPRRDAERLERAIAEEEQARAEVDEATEELGRLRAALRTTERRAADASRRLERATAKREKLDQID